MPNSPKRDYSRERKLGRIGGTLRLAGSVLGSVGKALSQSGSSIRERMVKEHGKYYVGPYGKGGTAIRGQTATKWAQTMKYTDPYRKKAIQYMIERRDPQKPWSPGRKGLTEKMIREEAYPLFVKEFGEKGAQEFLKALTLGGDSAHSKYAGGKEITLERVLKEDLPRVKNVRKEQKPIAEQILRGLLPPFEQSSQKHLTQEKLAEVVKETEERFGKETAAQLERIFGVQTAGQDSSKGTPQTSKRVVGLREGFLGGWGRRTSGGDAGNNTGTNIKKAA